MDKMADDSTTRGIAPRADPRAGCADPNTPEGIEHLVADVEPTRLDKAELASPVVGVERSQGPIRRRFSRARLLKAAMAGAAVLVGRELLKPSPTLAAGSHPGLGHSPPQGEQQTKTSGLLRAAPEPGASPEQRVAQQAYLIFDGRRSYVEVPNSRDFSVSARGALTVAAWIRPDTLRFPSNEKGYVHWLGKGEPANEEWAFRMYNKNTKRPSRISFYLFNLSGGLGVGSYFQDPITAGKWIHVVGVADGRYTHIYRDGVHRDSDRYSGQIKPRHGKAPLRIGTRDFHSWFRGAITQVQIWNRALTGSEVKALYRGKVPKRGLVANYPFRAARDSAGHHPGVAFGPTCGTDL